MVAPAQPLRRRRPRSVAAHLAVATAVAATSFASSGPTAAASDPTRTFGSVPLDDVIAAATAEARCDLNPAELTAIVLAPTFPETGAPTTQAPSPMTLSRWDNKPAIESGVETWRLFAFADKSTPYRRAFWNPGVGPWQFDSAGAGSAFSAESYISTGVAAREAAAKMATLWCEAKANPAQYPDNAARRARAWSPWHGCKNGVCETIFHNLYDPVTKTNRNLVRDTAVGQWGGMEARSCKLPTVPGEFLCFYVDPGRAQGYKGWTTSPEGIFDGNGRPVKTPLAAPFYVYRRDGKEYRHFLRVDTGYNREISAARPLGKNARTSLVWSDLDQLCDRSLFRGTCDIAPSPKSTRAQSIQGSYQPIVGNFRNVNRDDILWYRPHGNDLLWRSTGSGTFLPEPISVSGHFTPIVGDFNGDGHEDIYWFSPTGGDALYRGTPSGFTATYPNANGDFTPLVGDFNGDGRSDIYWFSEWGGDAIYYGQPNGFTATYPNANGEFDAKLVGDFNGDTIDDIYWFSETAGDAIYYGTPIGFTATYPNANGKLWPLVGDFDGDTIDDIYWWSSTSGDALYYGNPTGFSAVYPNADGPFMPVVLDLDDVPGNDIVWYGPGSTGDAFWKSTGNRASPFTGGTTVIFGHYLPIQGNFDGDSGRDVLWYDTADNPDPLWYG